MSEIFNPKTSDFNLDLSYLKDVSSGSSEFMIEMIDLFLAQTPEYFENLAQFIKDENWVKVGELAHKIKPTLAFMGADSAKESMVEIENKARNLIDTESISASFKELHDFSAILFKKLKEVRKELED
jgi:HPt (histidine-containing phosphotransfer) domain-containing protein